MEKEARENALREAKSKLEMADKEFKIVSHTLGPEGDIKLPDIVKTTCNAHCFDKTGKIKKEHELDLGDDDEDEDDDDSGDDQEDNEGDSGDDDEASMGKKPPVKKNPAGKGSSSASKGKKSEPASHPKPKRALKT